MVDLDIINGTIAEWEQKDLTFLVVERLAWLYIVRDNALMRVKEEDGKEPVIMPAVAISSGSEFMEACSKADPVKMWAVLDDLMDAIKQLQPRLYNATIDRIKEV